MIFFVLFFQDSNKFNYSAFTIICSGWSYEIGLVLTEKMEANGIKVTLIVFEMPLHSRLEKLYDAAHEKVSVLQYFIHQENWNILSVLANL